MIKQYIAYLRDNPKGYWFKRKLYGWGWIPATWQGWLILLGYLLLVFAFAMTIDEQSPIQEVAFLFFFPVILLTISLIFICYTKGEKPRWQWGEKKKK